MPDSSPVPLLSPQLDRNDRGAAEPSGGAAEAGGGNAELGAAPHSAGEEGATPNHPHLPLP